MRRMRSWSKVAGLPLMLSALCASVGCSQDTASTAVAVEVVSNPLIQNLALAQGFNPSTESPALHQCFAHDPPVETDLYTFSSRAFAAYDRDEMVSKFARLNQMMSNPVALEPALNELHAQVASPRVLVLPIFVQTIERSVEPAEGGTSYCDPQNFNTPGEGSVREQFTEECGIQYLKSERYGGYVFLAIDASQLTQDEWRKALRVTQAGALTDSKDAEKTLAELEAIFGADALFAMMRTDYIPAPEPAFMRDGKLILSKWSDYATQITQVSQDPNGGPNRHGAVTRQVFGVYSQSLVNTCTQDQAFAQGFECYNNFNTKLMEFQHGEVTKNLLAQFAWLGDPQNRDRIEWPEGVDPNTEQAIYDQIYRSADICDNGMIDNHRRTCNDAFFNDPIDACRDCVINEVCDPEELTRLARMRPPYKIKDPTVPPPASTLRTFISSSSDPAGAIGSASDLLCLLSGVQGDFAGAGEAIRMTVNSNNEWILDVHGAQRVDGIGHCVNRSEFFGHDDDQTWLTDHHHNIAATQGINTLDGNWVTALQGLHGKMRGGGEAVWASQGVPGYISRLNAQSFQGELLRAYSTSFGLMNFFDPNGRWALNENGRTESSLSTQGQRLSTTAKVGEHELLLAHSEDAICYLTKLQGLFGGSSDSAKLTVNGEGFWVLSVSGKCQAPGKFLAYGDLPCSTDEGVRDVRAIARCLKYEQGKPAK